MLHEPNDRRRAGFGARQPQFALTTGGRQAGDRRETGGRQAGDRRDRLETEEGQAVGGRSRHTPIPRAGSAGLHTNGSEMTPLWASCRQDDPNTVVNVRTMSSSDVTLIKTSFDRAETFSVGRCAAHASKNVRSVPRHRTRITLNLLG